MSTDTTGVDLVGDEVVSNLARAALFAALTGALAYVAFPNPFSPAPITLQVLGVFLAALFLGPIWGGTSMVLYLLAGAIGAPVFAGGGAGIGVLLGPTAGYLWSYPVATALIGALAHRGFSPADLHTTSTGWLAASLASGVVVVYALGTVGFALVLGVGLETAFLTASAAFIPAEALKIAAAITIVRNERLRAA